ncbi:MAG: diacylglycerol kinase catalytic subunit [Bacillota bacterium]|nr:MAG: diacylglycerol kinase catalytic subunit [Bacillota bacterium]
MYVTPQAKLNDGLLHICLVNELGKLELLQLLSKVYSGKHASHKAVEFHTCQEILINTESPMIKMFDGIQCS